MTERTLILAIACWIALAVVGDATVASYLGGNELLLLAPIIGSVLLWKTYVSG